MNETAAEQMRRMVDAKALQSAYMEGFQAGLAAVQGLATQPAPIVLCADCPQKAAVLVSVSSGSGE
jgi:hypothetical protein